VIQDDFWERLAIESQGDASVSQKGVDPVAHGRVKAKEAKDVHKAINVKVVKEALDVEEEECCNSTTLDTGLNCMCHAENCISSGVIVVGAKLFGWEEVETRSIEQNLFGNDLFQEFATALKERDWPVSLHHPVIYFTGLRDWNDSGAAPWVVSPVDSSVEQACEA